MLPMLQRLSDGGIDALPFGVIGFADAQLIRRCNQHESRETSLRPKRATGRPLFTEIEPS